MLLHSIDDIMEIIACPLCGSKNTHSMILGNAILPYFARGYACEDCQFKGVPLIFSSEKIYKNFLNLLKKI
jgi:DNA-directed RNA polymerase subunit RPC12/RpoP